MWLGTEEYASVAEDEETDPPPSSSEVCWAGGGGCSVAGDGGTRNGGSQPLLIRLNLRKPWALNRFGQIAVPRLA